MEPITCSSCNAKIEIKNNQISLASSEENYGCAQTKRTPKQRCNMVAPKLVWLCINQNITKTCTNNKLKNKIPKVFMGTEQNPN
jgi:hypothetical protein